MPRSSAALYYTVRPVLLAGIASDTFWTLKDAAEAQGRCGGRIGWAVEAAKWDAESGLYLAYLLQDGFFSHEQALDWILDIHPDAAVSPRWDGLVVTPPHLEVLVALAQARPHANTDYASIMARMFHNAYQYEAEPLQDWQEACADRLAALIGKGPQ